MNKYSKQYDQMILDELTGKTFPTQNFEKEIRNIFRKYGYGQKLWWSNIPNRIRDENGSHDVNYRCCPESPSIRHLFCLVLDQDSEKHTVTVREGYLDTL